MNTTCEPIKDALLKVRVNKETLTSLDKIAKSNKQTRSELVRNIISSSDFENMCNLHSLYKLEECSRECIDYFESDEFKIDEMNISDQFPAFLTPDLNSPDIAYLSIKYPTYKVKVLYTLSDKKQSLEEFTMSLKILLGDLIHDCDISLAKSILIADNKYTTVFLPEIVCLNRNSNAYLAENEILKNKICELIKSKNLHYEVWPYYYLRSKKVGILHEGINKYIVPIKESKEGF